MKSWWIHYGVTGAIVVQVSQCLASQVHHKLYADNYFTSLPVIRYFTAQGICYAGTVGWPKKINLQLQCQTPSSLFPYAKPSIIAEFQVPKLTTRLCSKTTNFQNLSENKLDFVILFYAKTHALQSTFTYLSSTQLNILCSNFLFSAQIQFVYIFQF